ncbi:MAG: glycosyltransferase, partial [Stellaceae bacterium]
MIIPTLNAADTLPRALNAVRSEPPICEVIVSDGGSADETVAVAVAGGARVIATSPGRGAQLTAGAAAASSDWLLFLHADCRLE